MEWVVYVQAFQGLCTLLLGLWVALDRRNRAARAEVEALKERLARAEGRLESVMTDDDAHALSLSVADLNGIVGTLKAELRGLGELMARIDRTVTRQEEYLLNRKA